MDPKTFAKLDPKLRETYERVMGTTIPQKPTIVPAAPVTPPSTGTAPAHTQETKETITPSAPAHTVVAAATPKAPELPPLPETKETVHSTIAVHTAVATPNHAHEEKKEIHESTSAVPAWKKLLFIVLGIIFFSIYAIFWLLYFKVQLPF